MVFRSTRRRSFSIQGKLNIARESAITHRFHRSFRYGRKDKKGKQDPD